MIYVFLAKGFEEVEAIATVDFLRRCDLQVTTVGVGFEMVTGSHGITVKADCLEEEIVLDENLQAVVLPGGMPGTLNLEKSSFVQSAIDFASEKNKVIAAICAAPSILGHKMLLIEKDATCFPGFEEQLFGANVKNNAVCESSNIITGKAAGVTFKFASAIARKFVNSEKVEKVLSSLECNS